MTPDSKETKFGSSKQEVSHQQVKILGQFYCHVPALKCIPTAISGGVDISEVPGYHLL